MEFLESFLTHLIGLRECKLCGLSCVAADAPAPAGPCAAALSAPASKEIETPKSRTVPTNGVFFIRAPSLQIPDKNDAAGRGLTHPVGHSADAAKSRSGTVLLQSDTLALRTGGEVGSGAQRTCGSGIAGVCVDSVRGVRYAS